MLTAKQAKFQLEFSLTMMMVGRVDEGKTAFNKVLGYLNDRIKEEEHMDSLREFVEEGPE